MDETAQRRALVETQQQAARRGLNAGTSGNASLRCAGGFLITPSGIPPEALTPEQMVRMDGAGSWEGRWRPSSEWAIHARIYAARPEVRAVLHAHPDHAVALSCLRQPLPAFHYMVAGLGGDHVPCARYARFGSFELAETVVEALGSRFHACLMANHGITTCGPDLATALARALRLELLARQYLLARAAGTPVLLSTEEMAAVQTRYGSYGQQEDVAKG